MPTNLLRPKRKNSFKISDSELNDVRERCRKRASFADDSTRTLAAAAALSDLNACVKGFARQQAATVHREMEKTRFPSIYNLRFSIYGL
ncbi:MAG TPA: hypothetical protein VER76_05375 [Pyrinomonadaceae bacterium]|nr:hypothetical protein [Pyrinomonadaceae bacterium]